MKETYKLAKNYHAAGLRQKAEAAGLTPNAVDRVVANAKSKTGFGKKLQNVVNIMSDPMGHLKKKVAATTDTVRAGLQKELDTAARKVVQTTRDEIRSAVQDEIKLLKARVAAIPKDVANAAMRKVRNAPRAILGTAIKHPVAAAITVGGALGTHYARQRAMDYMFGRKKTVEASLKLDNPVGNAGDALIGGAMVYGAIQQLKDAGRISAVAKALRTKFRKLIARAAENNDRETAEALLKAYTVQREPLVIQGRKKLLIGAGVGGIGGAMAYRGVSRMFSKPKVKKELKASLELSAKSAAKKKLAAEKAAATRKANALLKQAKLPYVPKIVRPLSKTGIRIRNGAAVLAGAALLHSLYKHATRPEIKDLRDLEASLELDYIDRTGRLRADDGTYKKNPNSKTQLRAKYRELRDRNNLLKSSSDPVTGAPNLRQALRSAKASLQDFYHADKEELAAPSNLFHAGKHAAVGAIHAGVATGATYGAYKAGKGLLNALKNKSPHVNKYLTLLGGALGAGGAASIGAYDHMEAAAQHAFAAANRRKK